MRKYKKQKEQRGLRVDVRNNNVEGALKIFKRKVKEGKVILTKGGGYTTSKESQDEADELFGKARSRFGFNPSGKNKGGKIKTYAKGGGVRKPNY